MKSAEIRDIPTGHVAFNGAKGPREVATMDDLYGHLTGLFELSEDTAFVAAGLEVIEELKRRITLPSEHLMGATEAFAILHSLSYKHSKVYKKDKSGNLIIDQSILKQVIDIINESTDIREAIKDIRESAQEVIEL